MRDPRLLACNGRVAALELQGKVQPSDLLKAGHNRLPVALAIYATPLRARCSGNSIPENK